MQFPEIFIDIFNSIANRIKQLPASDLSPLLLSIIAKITTNKEEKTPPIQEIEILVKLFHETTDITKLSKVDIEAYYLLALCELEGIGTKMDAPGALTIFTRLLSAHPYASYHLGMFYLMQAKDNSNSLEFFVKAEAYFKKGRQFWLVDMYVELALIYTQDFTEPYCQVLALEYSKMAAARKHARATEFVGICYQQGIGTPINIIESIKYYRESIKYFYYDAMKGDRTAWRKMGCVYQTLYRLEGNLVNLDRAKDCYLMSANFNCSRSMLYLAHIYENGMGTCKDLKKAEHYYSLAARTKDKYCPAEIKDKAIEGQSRVFALLNNSGAAASATVKLQSLQIKPQNNSPTKPQKSPHLTQDSRPNTKTEHEITKLSDGVKTVPIPASRPLLFGAKTSNTDKSSAAANAVHGANAAMCSASASASAHHTPLTDITSKCILINNI